MPASHCIMAAQEPLGMSRQPQMSVTASVWQLAANHALHGSATAAHSAGKLAAFDLHAWCAHALTCECAFALPLQQKLDVQHSIALHQAHKPLAHAIWRQSIRQRRASTSSHTQRTHKTTNLAPPGLLKRLRNLRLISARLRGQASLRAAAHGQLAAAVKGPLKALAEELHLRQPPRLALKVALEYAAYAHAAQAA